MFHRCLLLAALCLSCTTTSPSTSTSSPDLGDLSTREKKIAAIDALALHALSFAALEKMPVAGLSVAVYLGQEPFLVKGYGLADLETGEAVRPDHIFRIGSVTKSFTAAGIMSLVEAGKLQLDDPVIRYLPQYDGKGTEITVRQLLTHTSGLNSFTESLDWPQLENTPLSRQDQLEFMLTQPRKFKPGEDFAYSNSGYFLLGLIIEKVSGESYADFVQQHLIAKAGLKSTRYCPSEQNYPKAAKGYSIEQGRNVPAPPVNMDLPFAAGALCSTAHDLAQWILALAKGQVIRPESYQQMITSGVLNNGKPSRMSAYYGFGLQAYVEDGHQFVGHGGDISGFLNTMDYYPNEDLVVVVQGNTNSSVPVELAATVAHALLGSIKDLPIDREEAAALIGTYHIPDIGMSAWVSWDNDELVARAINEDGQTGPSMRLLSQGDGRYWISEKAAEIRFVKKDGQLESVIFRLFGKDYPVSKLP